VTASYDTLGTTYRTTRGADPRIVDSICKFLALPTGARVLDVGAGTGNYARALADHGYLVTALEPSRVMMEQSDADDRIRWVQGCAEKMPFADAEFDAAILMLSVHHFSVLSEAFREIHRVTGGGAVVLFTYDPQAVESPWLFRYFPTFREDIVKAFPPVQELTSFLAAHGEVALHEFHLPPDLLDGFAGAAWRTPERYLDQDFRDGTSAFRQLPADVCEQGVNHLREDLASGTWDREFGHIRSLETYPHGYTFVVTPGSRATGARLPEAAVRRANAADAEAIAELYRELVPDPDIRVVPESIASLSESSGSFLLVAESAGVVCGTALLTICPDVMYGTQPFGVVENVVVAEGMRGHGIGRTLLTHIEQLARARECSKLMLSSSADREAAHGFFRHCGFASDMKLAFVKYRSRFSLS
jgi:SAM-dependent methyltransferase/N-acetylglutamate synthase-like GNAT family acetyltransferase